MSVHGIRWYKPEHNAFIRVHVGEAGRDQSHRDAYLTGHTTNEILNEYVNHDPQGEMAKYFAVIQPLLESIQTQARKIGIDKTQARKMDSGMLERRIISPSRGAQVVHNLRPMDFRWLKVLKHMKFEIVPVKGVTI